MSSTTAISATYAGGGGGVLGTLSRVGRSLMLPIAVLPAAALLLRFGQDDLLGENGRIADLTDVGGLNIAALLAGAGSVIFDNLPLLFAVGIAIGFARRSDGSTALAAVVGWLVFNEVFTLMVEDNPTRTLPDGTTVLPSMGVLSGILMGIVTALLYQRYYRVKLVPWLAFFGGRRFVPIITALTALVLGVIFGAIWPPVGNAINDFGDWIVDQGGIGAGIYGTVNRALIPFGLHNIINPIMWFVVGEYTPPGAGQPVFGDLHRYFAGDPDSGLFMAGFFPVMMWPPSRRACHHAHRKPRPAQGRWRHHAVGRIHVIPDRRNRAGGVRVHLRGAAAFRYSRHIDGHLDVAGGSAQHPHRIRLLGQLHRFPPQLREEQYTEPVADLGGGRGLRRGLLRDLPMGHREVQHPDPGPGARGRDTDLGSGRGAGANTGTGACWLDVVLGRAPRHRGRSALPGSASAQWDAEESFEFANRLVVGRMW
jgi:PTS system N-acetylglucosamine-specific IIC component